jgi:hypothetical protein
MTLIKPIAPHVFKQIIGQIIRTSAKLPTRISLARKKLKRRRFFGGHED